MPDSSKRNARVPDRYQALVKGEMSVEDLDDDELIQGRLRAVDGTFKGRVPNAIPRSLHKAVVKELVSRTERRLLADLEDMYAVLREIAEAPRAPAVARVQAATYLIERVSGKTPDKVEIHADVRKFEQLEGAGLLMDIEVEPQKALPPVPDPNVVDAEIVEEPKPKRTPVRRKRAS